MYSTDTYLVWRPSYYTLHQLTMASSSTLSAANEVKNSDSGPHHYILHSSIADSHTSILAACISARATLSESFLNMCMAGISATSTTQSPRITYSIALSGEYSVLYKRE